MKHGANKSPNKSWQKTTVQNLVRHKSGRYYARAFGNNKEIWKSLRADHFSVAKARLAEFLREHWEKQVAVANHSSAEMTFAEVLTIHLQDQADDVTIKPTTRHYWTQVFTSLLKSWPGLAEREVRRITKTDCTEWARQLGIPRITHHDLRHLLATVGIEAGIDIPTVSRWLGHKDGGALAMKTYGHLRREHSVAQALKVSFAPITTKQADVIPFRTTA